MSSTTSTGNSSGSDVTGTVEDKAGVAGALLVTRVLAACFHSYTGNPSWITGHALRKALKLSAPVSNGLFTMATSLPPVITYREFSGIRSRPEPLMFSLCRGYGRGKKYNYVEYKPTCLAFDITGKAPGVRPGKWFLAGGRKNSGHGNFKVLEVQEINLLELTYPEQVEWARLVSPVALKSLPAYFQRQRIRKSEQWFYHGQQRERITIADAGQVFKLENGMTRKQLKEVMIKGIKRTGYRASFGLGEYYCF